MTVEADEGVTPPERFHQEVDGIAKADASQRSLFEELLGLPGVRIYLHGSRADGTATAFSDYDDLLIVDEQAYQEPGDRRRLKRGLRAVDRRFMRRDPLQHHGHWLVYEHELDDYDASRLPVVVLERGVVVQGPSSVSCQVNVEETQAGLADRIEVTAEQIASLRAPAVEGAINLYRLKAMASSISLLPALVHQHRGNWLDKATAIEARTEVFGGRACDAIDWATRVREDWRQALDTTRYRAFAAAARWVPSGRWQRQAAAWLSPSPPESFLSSHEPPDGAIEALVSEARREGESGGS